MTEPVPYIDVSATRLEVESRSFRLLPMNLSSVGMFSGELEASGALAHRWVAKLTFPVQREDEWREWEGIIASLDGVAGRMRVFDPARRAPYFNVLAARATAAFDDGATFDDGALWESGTLPPLAVVRVLARRGATGLVIGGLPASTSTVLRPADLFEIRPGGEPAAHGHLYQVTRISNSDAEGDTLVEFKPPLRAGVAVGDQVVLKDPRTMMRLASDDEGEITVSAPNHGRLGLTLAEVLPRP